MLGSTLIGHQIVQVCEPREKRLLAATGMMGADVPREMRAFAQLVGR
jgi:hypothetical protein